MSRSAVRGVFGEKDSSSTLHSGLVTPNGLGFWEWISNTPTCELVNCSYRMGEGFVESTRNRSLMRSKRRKERWTDSEAVLIELLGEM